MYVKPKKSLGQHFLTNYGVAEKISDALDTSACSNVLEIGPGTGVLTQYLINKPQVNLVAIDIDKESIQALEERFDDNNITIIHADFMKVNLSEYFSDKFLMIGNLPYYISSQILFKMLEHKNDVLQGVFMLQKEVAERIASAPKSKRYGILSVLLQAYFDIKYLFTVHENSFKPAPRVKSAVVSFTRNSVQSLNCNEILFKKVIKTCFNQRRKTIKNSLKSNFVDLQFEDELLTMRPEQLSVNQFVTLTNLVEKNMQL